MATGRALEQYATTYTAVYAYVVEQSAGVYSATQGRVLEQYAAATILPITSGYVVEQYARVDTAHFMVIGSDGEWRSCAPFTATPVSWI